MWETWVQPLVQEDPLEKEMAIHSSTLAWKIPWTEKPGRLQSMGSQRIGHDWATSLSLVTLSPLESGGLSIVQTSKPRLQLSFPKGQRRGKETKKSRWAWVVSWSSPYRGRSFPLCVCVCVCLCTCVWWPLSWNPSDSVAIQRRWWQSTPVLLPGKSHGWRSLVGCSPWGRWESDMTERLHFHFSLSFIGEGNGNPLQYSCLENPRDGGAWWAAIYGVAESRTQLKRLSSSSSYSH